MTEILFIAPINNIHTLKWIDYFQKDSRFTLRTFSLYTADTKHADNYQEIIENTKYFKLGPLIFRMFLMILYLLCLTMNYKLRRKKYVIHSHTLGPHGLCGAFCIGRKIVTIWGSDIEKNSQNIILHMLIKFQLYVYDIVTADTKKYNRNNIIQRKFEQINFGIDYKIFDPVLVNSTDVLRLLITRNHYSVYNNVTIVKALHELAVNNISFTATFAGSGPERTMLEEYVSQSKLLKERVKFFGAYNFTQLKSLLTEANVYISASLRDAGIAASISEAMVCKKIVVASDSSDNKEWITTDCGYLFEATNYLQLARILMNIDLKADLTKGENARLKILEKNNLQIEMNKMATIYQRHANDQRC